MNAKYSVLLAPIFLTVTVLAQTPMQPQADPEYQSDAPSMQQPPTSPDARTPIESSGSSSIQSDQSSGVAGLQALPVPTEEPTPKTVGGITYLCGGVGADEASRMKQAARDYGLMLTFATRNGSYLADINVDITDAHGKPVLKAMCGAPIMLVDLPKGGMYRVHAEANGYGMTKTARISGKGHTAAVTLIWPSPIADAERASGTTRGIVNDSR